MSNRYWQDQKSGLYWELKTFGNKRMEYTLAEALEYADELRIDKYGGFDDWRLPCIKELSSLCTVEPYAYDGNYNEWRTWFENIKKSVKGGLFITEELTDNVGKDGWYWSATPKNDSEYYLLNFKEGNINSHLPSQSFYVRCVRG
jgi:hypothetical protein